MPVELVVPSVGESITEVEIAEWHKSEGEAVAREEIVVVLDSEKTSVELPAPVAGRLVRILKQQGEAAQVGEVIAHIEEGEVPADSAEKPSASADSPRRPDEPEPEWDKKATPATAADQGGQNVADRSAIEVAAAAAAAEPAPAADASPAAATAEAPPEAPAQTPDQPSAAPAEAATGAEASLRVMPAARRLLAESGVTAEQVSPTGPGGRLLKQDVLEHLRGGGRTTPAAAPAPPAAPTPAPPAAPAAPAVAGEGEEVVRMSLLRRRVAERLVQAQQHAALLTTFNEVDMSAVMALRAEHRDTFQKKYQIKLGFMSFFVKASIDALKQFPAINAEIRGEDVVYRNYYDIGVAIGGGKGLVVPVLRRAERLSFAEVEIAIDDFARRARENQLQPDELMGGTFTITNGGIYGSLLSTPIVNPPQSGILGMHSIQERPVAENGQVVIKPMMYVALTYDHRIVDGREAVSFLVRVKQCIENPARMLLEV